MTSHYLSPAFHKRSDEELDFLRTIDEAAGFSLFWVDILRPLLQHIQARHLLEIGADRGDHTRLLIRYCDSCNGTLTIIEPAVSAPLKEIVDRSTRTMFFADRSCEALPRMNSAIDAVILEGDLNHHTVYGDLCGIEDLCRRCNNAFPVIFVKNISWPYARRDMYYAPEMIPPEARHEYAYNGMTPWSLSLQRGTINAPFANVEKEGGERNGVLTAVEDFMKVSAFPLRLFSLPLFYGLGIIHAQDSPAAEFIRLHIQPPPALALFLETTEIARINDILRRLQPPMPLKNSGNLLAGALRRWGRFIIKRIEK
jgi:hypothetical protein